MTDENDDEEVEGPARYPLAYDLNGNPLKVPEAAIAWRVRRGGGRRGRPRNVFDPETRRQLEIPIGASVDELIAAGCPADRYLLYPVTAEGHIVPGIVAATEIPEGVGLDEPDGEAELPNRDLITQLLQTVRAQSDTLCRALEAATSGYGPVRPAAPPQPVVFEQPASESQSASIKPEQIAEVASLAKSVFDMFRGPMPPATPPPVEGAP